MKTHETTIRVRYAETDRMKVAHHSSYLLWFELARTGLLRAAGYDYRGMEQGGTLLPVIEYNCRLLRGADYDDEVRIETSITKLRSRTIVFSYRALLGDEVIALGWTRHLCVDGDNQFKRLPGEIAAAIQPYVVPGRAS